MNLSTRNRIYIALLYGFYQIITQLYFSSFQFLDSSISVFLFYGLLFVSIFLLEFSILLFRQKMQQHSEKVVFISSFLISSCIASSFLWLVFSKGHAYYFTFIFSFIVSSFIPSIGFLFYFIYRETFEKFSQMSLVSLKNSENVENEESNKLFHLENSNGKLLLEVPISKILFFEANDNYVTTYYLRNENNLTKSMERISLKKIEEILTNEHVEFKRVHKSFLINPSYIHEIKGKVQAYKIKMDFYETLIPVSRMYDVSELNP